VRAKKIIEPLDGSQARRAELAKADEVLNSLNRE
jgi:hypothetical protein